MYVSLIGEMFIKGVKYLHKNLDKITMPIIYLHGENDPIVSVKASEDMYKLVPSKNKELIIYEDMQHEILNEVEKEKVLNDIINWLDKN